MEAALVGLVGVALGSGLALAGAWWSEQRRWHREDRQRWHGPRLQAYTTTRTQLTILVVEFRSAIAAARPRLQPPWAPYRLKRQFGTAKEALRLTLDQLELIRIVGKPPAPDTAERCIDVLGRLSETLSRWSRSMPDGVVDGFVRELEQAKVELRAAARAELDVEEPADIRQVRDQVSRALTVLPISATSSQLNPSIDQRLAREPITRLRPGRQYLDGFEREVERLLKVAARCRRRSRR